MREYIPVSECGDDFIPAPVTVERSCEDPKDVFISLGCKSGYVHPEGAKALADAIYKYLKIKAPKASPRAKAQEFVVKVTVTPKK